jgi:hypothetical protein
MFLNHCGPAHRRYAMRTWGFLAPYVAINIAAIAGLFDRLEGGPGAWALALAVSIPIAGQIWAVLALMNESDEFMRALTAKRFIVAAGAAMALFTGWGFAESYAEAPHAPGWLVYVLFWVAFCVTAPFIKTTR